MHELLLFACNKINIFSFDSFFQCFFRQFMLMVIDWTENVIFCFKSICRFAFFSDSVNRFLALCWWQIFFSISPLLSWYKMCSSWFFGSKCKYLSNVNANDIVFSDLMPVVRTVSEVDTFVADKNVHTKSLQWINYVRQSASRLDLQAMQLERNERSDDRLEWRLDFFFLWSLCYVSVVVTQNLSLLSVCSLLFDVGDVVISETQPHWQSSTSIDLWLFISRVDASANEKWRKDKRWKKALHFRSSQYLSNICLRIHSNE